jgi:glycosyltransferase involved in cell wall biosynthesis
VAKTIRGCIDEYLDGHIIGWAWDTNTPNDSLTVEVLIDDVALPECVADIYRAGLRDAGFGNGHHEFRANVPAQFFDSAPHRVTIRVKGIGSDLTSPKIFVFGDRQAVVASAQSCALPLGRSGPLISLIMPTYNRGAIMERSVRGYARCDQWDNTELIIVDDGSRDDTPRRLEKLASEFKNIRFVRIENSGPARARNIAAGMASAPLLLFIGDDVKPSNVNFIDAHLKAHETFPDHGAAVLGKITWQARAERQVNFVMQHVQGDGQQQFGYKFMEPYRWYDWRLFYSSNISLKKGIVADWSRDGYDEGFNEYGYEDAELAFRLTRNQKSQGRDFQILYVPAAVLAHDHPYSITTFIRRQVSCGLMARRFFEKHPEVASAIGIHELNEKLREPISEKALPIEHYFTVFEGIKSWALIVEHHDGLGSQNWHGDLLKAVFHLAYCEGYLRAITRPDANLPLAARTILERTIGEVNHALFREIIGVAPPPKLV